MINRLKLKNFTLFDNIDITFSPGLNVIVGENGTGKTHLLKIGYLLCKALDQAILEDPNRRRPAKAMMEQFLADRLMACFKPDSLGGLARHGAKERGKTGVYCELNQSPTYIDADTKGSYSSALEALGKWKFNFSSQSSRKVNLEAYLPNEQVFMPVYLPAKEIVSFMEGLVGLYQKREVSFDETIYDLAVNLDPIAFRTEPDLLNNQIGSLVELVGGKLEKEGGKFYVVKNSKEKREITLVAEGLRKLATLQRLIAVGSLQRGATLYWDEPESNLNPKLIRVIAEILIQMVGQGVQVIIATHSLFLMRELEILSQEKTLKHIKKRYFALVKTDNVVTVEQDDTVEGLNTLVLLDEELSQSDRYLEMEE